MTREFSETGSPGERKKVRDDDRGEGSVVSELRI
jgi:hypothetical protein